MNTDDTSSNDAPILMLPPSTTSGALSLDASGDRFDGVVSLRKYGSGLGNLGNTCFMNSTLQCLGHTYYLQKYFLSGAYLPDLNRENPLGTGGDLATEFAKMMREIWVQAESHINHTSYVPSHVVYPRPFKTALGRHAEQFMGYDQHDSQEFATYLLDALHEDTNRVTKKPYIEKPEQGEKETDEQAADKAWSLHLQREDSRVLESFMGQVKSRVQCCEEGCGRVSTTFDPFMYLSCPIPGSADRILKIVFVPLDPEERPRRLVLSISKNASIADLILKCHDRLVDLGMDPSELAVEDMVAIDIWSNEVYSWYEDKILVETIRDTDETFIYALRPLSEVRRLSSTPPSTSESEEHADTLVASHLPSSGRKYQLDIATLRKLNHSDNLHSVINGYLRNYLSFLNTFNPTKGTTEGRMKFLNELRSFVHDCHMALDKKEADETGEATSEDSPKKTMFMAGPSQTTIQELVELTEDSQLFESVTSKYDVAVLEFCAGKLREEIINLIQQKKKRNYPDGILIQTRSRCFGSYASSRDNCLAGPLVVRIPSNLTVYELREELADRMRRSIRTGLKAHASSGQETSEVDAQRATGLLDPPSPKPRTNGTLLDNSFGSPALMTIRQVPLSYNVNKDNKSSGSSSSNSTQLGSLVKPGMTTERRGKSLASPSDEDEKELVVQLVGDKGTVNLEWPRELADTCFDTVEFSAIDEVHENGHSKSANQPKETTTVLDCIGKYCQKEQLEESEMWYCSRCKKHVRAWKQFHLYRAPPVLIIHLKRFQFSAITHRRDKISRFIDFPLEGLDLSEHVMHPAGQEKPIYDCYAVSNHFGNLGGGHYTAHALNSDGVWCYYDDSRITTNVDPKEAVSDAAYVLYYRRRDVPTDQDFTLSTATPEERPAPAIIFENPDKVNGGSSLSNSNAVIIRDDDNMDIDSTDVVSRSTSPMESVDGAEDLFGASTYNDSALPDDHDQLPRQ